MERVGAFMVRHPFVVTTPLVALALALLGVGIYNLVTVTQTRGEVIELQPRVTSLELSPCNQAPRGPRCQAILTAALCKLQPRLLSGCDRDANTKPNPGSPTEGGDDETESPGGGPAVGSPPAGGPDDPADTGGGGGDDGPIGDPPEPSPPVDPPEPSPPDPPAPASPEPPASSDGVLGIGIDPEVPGVGSVCDLAPVACP